MRTAFRPAVLAALFVAAMTAFFHGSVPSDFLAVYFAGLQFGAGQYEQIYPAVAPVFDLSYPASWDALAQARGIDAQAKLYPFIYPPLWAAMGAWIAPISVPVIAAAVAFANACLLAACSYLGWRITRSTLPLTLWLTAGVVSMATTTFGFVALSQGQPQILTTFLILAAIERAQARAPVTAGIALAVAASIKLYPLIFVALWLARGNWRAAASFAVAGAALATLSVSLAGWPLHREFLAQIGIISDSILLTYLSYNLSAVIAAFSVDFVSTPMPYSAAANPAVALISKLALLLSVGIAMWAARGASERVLYTQVWPLTLIAVSFFSPMSWSYHFLTALAFAPLALEQSRMSAKICFGYLCVVTSVVTSLVAISFLVDKATLFASGVSALAALTALFCLARPEWTAPEPEPLLHP